MGRLSRIVLTYGASFLVLAGCAVRLGRPVYNAQRGEFRGGLDPAIDEVSTAGMWKDGEAYGRYRLVVRRQCSPDHCFSEAYLQWMQITEDEPAESIELVTVPVHEVADHAGLVIRAPRFVEDREGPIFYLQAGNTYAAGEGEVRIRPRGKGAYTFQLLCNWEGCLGGKPAPTPQSGAAYRPGVGQQSIPALN